MVVADQRLKKFDHSLLADIVDQLELSQEINEKIQALTTDIEIIEALKAENQWQHAIKFLAYGLPARETIWWAYISVTDTLASNEDKATKDILQLTEAWVKNPTEANRRLAGKLADEVGLYISLGWLATAIFWSGGSITPEDKLSVEPAEFMCATAAINAMALAASNSSDKAVFYQKVLKRGLHIAMGGNGRVE